MSDHRSFTSPREARRVAGPSAEELLVEASTAGSADRRHLLDEVVVRHLDLAARMARQYAGRGLDVEDLAQVARLALCKAAHSYDPDAGGSFVAYAAPTMLGEIKRHFRDTGWLVRPPRRLQEMRARLRVVEEELRQAAHEEPSESDLAEALDVEVADVREARLCDAAYHAVSMEALAYGDSAGRAGGWDGGYERVEDRMALRAALTGLSSRDRLIVRLRFVEERTQSEIAAVIGVSQMQVSRLLTRIMAGLRASIEDARESSTEPSVA